MEYIINLNAVLPVRAESSETSEMVTQLLFGEYAKVLDSKGSFTKVRNFEDGYEGWADTKMLTEISADDYLNLTQQDVFRVCVPIADVFCLSDKTIYRFSAGSILPNYNPETSQFGWNEMSYQVHPSLVTYLPSGGNKEGIIPTAMQFLNSPYLWGGKNILGIDCSGFVQVVFSINGFSLPRDASQQIEKGAVVEFENAQVGDLLFFEKNNKVTHVAIYLGDGKVLHASGKVKIDGIDEVGISQLDGTYSHHLYAVRSI